MPGRCSCSYSPENGRSVALSRNTAYCIGVNSLRHSASLFCTLPGMVLVSGIATPSWSRLSVGDLGAGHQRRLLDVGVRKNLLQVPDLRHDRLLVDFCGVELRDIGLSNLLLLVGSGEDRRAILRAAVRALPVQLRRVVRHREEDLQDLAVADLLRVVFDLH